MFMMSKYCVIDAIESAKVIRSKISYLEVELNALVVEQLRLMKAYSVVEHKLHKICSHDWEKIGNYQFATSICNMCGIEEIK
tara:strand:+ start:1145 stop:1390 length:246 start_codon:yes stop_codon:yes gene_type:complete